MVKFIIEREPNFTKFTSTQLHSKVHSGLWGSRKIWSKTHWYFLEEKKNKNKKNRPGLCPFFVGGGDFLKKLGEASNCCHEASVQVIPVSEELLEVSVSGSLTNPLRQEGERQGLGENRGKLYVGRKVYACSNTDNACLKIIPKSMPPVACWEGELRFA